MIWLTARQLRTPALTVAAALLVTLGALALTWSEVAGLARDTGLTGCQATACDDAATDFLAALRETTAGLLYIAGNAGLLGLPVLLGMFWGAPLIARELETGTYRMIFSQSVSRRRWLLVKLAVGGGAAGLSAGLASLVLGRWAAPIDRAEANRIDPTIFTTRGVAPVAYAALAFVIGVTAGLVLRRTLPAMTATLLVVTALLIVAPRALPRLLVEPVTSVAPLNLDGRFQYDVNRATNEVDVSAPAGIPGAWVWSKTTVTAAGAPFRVRADPAQCDPRTAGAPQVKGAQTDDCRAWLASQHLSQKVTYVPASSFWALQWRVSGALGVLTLGLSWFALWWIRHRLA